MPVFSFSPCPSAAPNPPRSGSFHRYAPLCPEGLPVREPLLPKGRRCGAASFPGSFSGIGALQSMASPGGTPPLPIGFRRCAPVYPGCLSEHEPSQPAIAPKHTPLLSERFRHAERGRISRRALRSRCALRLRPVIGVLWAAAFLTLGACAQTVLDRPPNPQDTVYVDPATGKDLSSRDGTSSKKPFQTLNYAYSRKGEALRRIVLLDSPNTDRELEALRTLRTDAEGEVYLFSGGSSPVTSEYGREGKKTSGSADALDSMVTIAGRGKDESAAITLSGAPGKRVITALRGARVRFEAVRISGGDSGGEGGGILLCDGAEVFLGEGCVVEGNKAARGGSGIFYDGGSLTFTADARVTADDSQNTALNNVVFLKHGNQITVMGSLTGNRLASLLVLEREVPQYVIKGALEITTFPREGETAPAPNYKRFAASVPSGKFYDSGSIDASGFLAIEGAAKVNEAAFYVDRHTGVDEKNQGRHRDTPLRTLSFALKLMASLSAGSSASPPVRRVVLLSSTDSAIETALPVAASSDAVYTLDASLFGAKEITLCGDSDEVTLWGAKGKRVITVETGVKLRTERIRISGGDTPGNGGGIFAAGGARVTLASGTVITGNRAAGFGSGVYITDGLLGISGSAKIGGNPVSSDTGDSSLPLIRRIRAFSQERSTGGTGDTLHLGAGAAIEILDALTGGDPVACITLDRDTSSPLLTGDLDSRGSPVSRANWEKFVVRTRDSALDPVINSAGNLTVTPYATLTYTGNNALSSGSTIVVDALVGSVINAALTFRVVGTPIEGVRAGDNIASWFGNSFSLSFHNTALVVTKVTRKNATEDESDAVIIEAAFRALAFRPLGAQGDVFNASVPLSAEDGGKVVQASPSLRFNIYAPSAAFADSVLLTGSPHVPLDGADSTGAVGLLISLAGERFTGEGKENWLTGTVPLPPGFTVKTEILDNGRSDTARLLISGAYALDDDFRETYRLVIPAAALERGTSLAVMDRGMSSTPALVTFEVKRPAVCARFAAGGSVSLENGNALVSGEFGKTVPPSFCIALEYASFSPGLTVTSAWFSSLPPGIQVAGGILVNQRLLLVTLGGTFSAPLSPEDSGGTVTITIPASAIDSGSISPPALPLRSGLPVTIGAHAGSSDARLRFRLVSVVSSGALKSVRYAPLEVSTVITLTVHGDTFLQNVKPPTSYFDTFPVLPAGIRYDVVYQSPQVLQLVFTGTPTALFPKTPFTPDLSAAAFTSYDRSFKVPAKNDVFLEVGDLSADMDVSADIIAYTGEALKQELSISLGSEDTFTGLAAGDLFDAPSKPVWKEWFSAAKPAWLSAKVGSLSTDKRKVTLLLSGTPPGPAPASALSPLTVPPSFLTRREKVPLTVGGAVKLFVIPKPTIKVSAVTVSGEQGSPIKTQTFTLTAGNAVFQNASTNSAVTSWFTNIPPGLTVTRAAAGGSTLSLQISGTPSGTDKNAVSAAAMVITVPSTAFTEAVGNITAEANPNARYAIGMNYTIGGLGLTAALKELKDLHTASPAGGTYTIRLGTSETINPAADDVKSYHTLSYASSAKPLKVTISAPSAVTITTAGASGENGSVLKVNQEYATVILGANVTWAGKAQNAADWGLFLVSGGTLVLDGAKITGNTALKGAAVYAYSGVFKMLSGTISNNTAAENGGAVYIGSIPNMGTFNLGSLLGSITIGNVAAGGTFSGGTISGNTATGKGGGIFIDTFSKSGVPQSGIVTLNGTAIGANGAPNRAVQGAGVYIANGNVTMSGGSISYNGAASGQVTTTAGSGVYLHRVSTGSSVFTLKGGTIAANLSSAEGNSGIYVAPYASFVMTAQGTVAANNSIFIGCESNYTFGKITLAGGALSTSAAGKIALGGVYSQAIGKVLFSSDDSSLTAANLGKFSVADQYYDISKTAPLGTLIPKGNTFYVDSSGSADNSGCDPAKPAAKVSTVMARLDTYKSAYGWNYSNATISVKGSHIDSFTCPALPITLAGNSANIDSGGKAYIATVNNGGKFTLASGVTFKNGSGVLVNSGGTFTMTGGSISGSNYTSFGINAAESTQVTINSGSIYGHKTGVQSAGVVIMTGGTIYNNNNTGGYGGGVAMVAPRSAVRDSVFFSMTGSSASITGNNADRGGGVHSNAYANVYLYDGRIGSNTARFGGGVYAEGVLDITSRGGTSCIEDNSAESGGGIYIQFTSAGYGRFLMDNGMVTGNKATVTGGGIYANLTTDAVYRIEGNSTIYYNSGDLGYDLYLTGNSSNYILNIGGVNILIGFIYLHCQYDKSSKTITLPTINLCATLSPFREIIVESCHYAELVGTTVLTGYPSTDFAKFIPDKSNYYIDTAGVFRKKK